MVTDAPFFLAGKKAFPPNNLTELIAWMKANPGKAIFGNGGNGSISHICGLLFMDITKTSAQVVPYRGNAPAMQDLVGGQIDMMIADPVTGVPQVKGNNIKAYGVTARNRLSTAPEIPTVDEAGLPGYHVSLWHGLWLPKAVPAPIVARLNAAAVEALADPTVKAKLAALGQDIFPRERQNPEALDAHQKAEIAKWWPLIKAAGIKAN
jgi:tripartite-type tricarboxylate transporter receptor subunit TctC